MDELSRKIVVVKRLKKQKISSAKRKLVEEIESSLVSAKRFLADKNIQIKRKQFLSEILFLLFMQVTKIQKIGEIK